MSQEASSHHGCEIFSHVVDAASTMAPAWKNKVQDRDSFLHFLQHFTHLGASLLTQVWVLGF